MYSDEVLIDIQNVSKRYEIYANPRDRLKQMLLPRLKRAMRSGSPTGGGHSANYFREFWALDDVSLSIKRGETIGIIGRNGSGKSTLLQIVAGTLAPTSGTVRTSGRIAALLELGSGFNPDFTGRENVYLNGKILGLDQNEISDRYEQIAEFADIGEFINEPVKTYSSGMFVRLAFAVQAHIAADIVIIDEALAVGDVFFTQKCYGRLQSLVDSGAAVILVSHDMATVSQFCRRVLVLDHGKTMFVGNPVSAINRYMSIGRETPANSSATASRLPPGTPTSTKSDLRWPEQSAFLDLGQSDVVGNGQAEFLGAAMVSASDGAARTLFQMGETVDFYYSFRVLQEMEVPLGGINIVNERNVIVHGINSLQRQIEAPSHVLPGTILRFRQRMVLDLGVGEYTFVVGLATTDAITYRNAAAMTHGSLDEKCRQVLLAGHVGAFTITFRLEGIAAPFHGLANLPGESELEVLDETAARAETTL